MKSTTYAIIFFFCLILVNTNIQAGEPVPGAEIYVELEPDDEPIFNGTTNEEGEFVFTIPASKELLKTSKLKITIVPPKLKSKVKSKKNSYKKQVITIDIPEQESNIFTFVLTWEPNAKAENKGAFAVSGKNSTKKSTLILK
jgi:hypothetical protein